MRFLLFNYDDVLHCNLNIEQVFDYLANQPWSTTPISIFDEWYKQSDIGEYLEVDNYVIVRLKSNC